MAMICELRASALMQIYEPAGGSIPTTQRIWRDCRQHCAGKLRMYEGIDVDDPNAEGRYQSLFKRYARDLQRTR